MQLFSADAIVFSKKILNFFLTPKKWKNGPQKLLIIGPDPFISQSSPDQRPTAQNWFFILWNLGTRHLFSYLWLTTLCRRTGISLNDLSFGSGSPGPFLTRGLVLTKFRQAYFQTLSVRACVRTRTRAGAAIFVQIQGVSYWNVLFELALRGWRINKFVALWCLVASGGADIWVSYTSL